ncbi:MAG: hypothetical protein SFV51_19340 [Bryobacteraceae bacterium]|nr:hypothetical protein [Bryobacteraceae bacterium]
MSESDRSERFLEALAGQEDLTTGGAAPSRLKSRIYSAMLDQMAETEPLASVTESKQCGGQLCIFEEIMERAPVGDTAKRWNYCAVCHARVLGERVENAPIYWPGCPYAQFQNR